MTKQKEYEGIDFEVKDKDRNSIVSFVHSTPAKVAWVVVSLVFCMLAFQSYYTFKQLGRFNELQERAGGLKGDLDKVQQQNLELKQTIANQQTALSSLQTQLNDCKTVKPTKPANPPKHGTSAEAGQSAAH